MAKEKNTKVEKLVEEIKNLTALELSELSKALQETFGVSPIAATAPALNAAAQLDQPSGSEQAGGAPATQTVVLANTGANKISVIKALREINQNLGLKEAKDLTESAPKDVLVDAKTEEAQAAKKKLEEAGATVELK